METQSRLRAARKKRGVTLVDVAEAVGVNHTHLSRVERGGLCSAALAAKLAAYFGRDVLHEMELLYPEHLHERGGVGPAPAQAEIAPFGPTPPARIRIQGHVYRLEHAA